MKRIKLNLLGQRFGKLVVIQELHTKRNRSFQWLCQCDCGNRHTVTTTDLKYGSTRSCGCYRRTFRQQDLTGQRFGKLIALSRDKIKKFFWICKCDCGKTLITHQEHLVGGGSKSCGCKRDETRCKKKKEKIGKRFGRLLIKGVERSGKKVFVLCDCGETKWVNYTSLQQGYTRSCGCLQRELTSARSLGKKNPMYNPQLIDQERIKRHSFTKCHEWSRDVLLRDNYTCQICEKKGNYLHAHHLNSWHWCKEERFSLNNGVALCVQCHKQFHKEYGRHNNTYNQFWKFKDYFLFAV